MTKMIFHTLVHQFPFGQLTVTRFYQLTYYILQTLHRIEPKLIDSSDYRRLKEEFEQFCEVYDRNPALLQTSELRRIAEQLRESVKTLGGLVKSLSGHGGSTRQEYAKQLAYIIKPCLKPHPAHQAIPDLLANAGKIAVDLQTPATTPMVAALDLTALVSEIDTLSHTADAIYSERSGEKELRHLLGSATIRRPILARALGAVLYSLLQAIHSLAPSAAERAEIDEIINHINGLFESYKIYTETSRHHHHSGEAAQPDFHAGGGAELS